jgi:hypothetical protein
MANELIERRAGSQVPKQPAVSVVVPAYNTASYIAETLDSVFAQTFTNFEVIVVNDGSTDTEQFEQELQPYSDRIIYVRQENRGASAARNVGINTASGEYIAFLDSDDLWLPSFLESQINALQQNPPKDFIYTAGLFFGDPLFDGRSIMEFYPSHGPVTFESLLIQKCVISTPGVVARKQCLVDAGLFDENITHAEDLDLWLRVAHSGATIGYQKDVLWKCRLRPGSLSTGDEQMRSGYVQVLTKLETILPLDQRLRHVLRDQIGRIKATSDLEHGRQCLQEGRFEEARRSFTSANAYLRKSKLRWIIAGLQFAPGLTRWAAGAWWETLTILQRAKFLEVGFPFSGRE